VLINREEENFKVRVEGPLFKELEKSKNKLEDKLCTLISNIYKETISYAEADNPELNLSADQINFIKGSVYNKCIDTFDHEFKVYFEDDAENLLRDFYNKLEELFLIKAYEDHDAIGFKVKRGYEDKAAEYVRNTFKTVPNKLDEFFNSEEFKKFNKDYTELKAKIMEL